MKQIVTLLLLSISTSLSAQVVYIGDFYKKGINIYQPSSSNELKNFIQNHTFDKSDKVVTTAGLELSCSNYKSVKDQLNLLTNKVSKIYLVKNYSCFGVESHLKIECAKIKNCKFIEPYDAYLEN